MSISQNPFNVDCAIVEYNKAHTDDYQINKEFFEKNDYTVLEINYSNLSNSAHYNPFIYCGQSNELFEIIENINAYIRNKFPEYIDSTLLQSLCLYLVEKCRPEDRHFDSVYKLLYLIKDRIINNKSTLDRMFDKLEQENPESNAVQLYKTFKMYPNKIQKEISDTYIEAFSFIYILDLNKIIQGDNLDLYQIASNHKFAIFITTEYFHPAYQLITDTLISQCKRITNNSGKKFAYLHM